MSNDTSRPLLEIHLHLTNGSTHRYVQDDPQGVQRILPHITPKVFALPTLVISCPDSAITYPGSALTGISLLMEPVPANLLHLMTNMEAGNVELQEITEEDYAAKRRVARPIVEGQPLVTVQEVEMTSGHRFWLEAHVGAAAPKWQERHILNTVFAQPALVCRRLGGGISLWNRSQMVSFSFCPKPDVPASAWPLEPGSDR